jgi:DNA-binding NarL/FixJ family response regulator
MPRSGFEGPSVLLVEDHQIFREGVRDLLVANGVLVAGEAADAASAVAIAADLRPQVALVDLRLPDAPGHDAIRRIRAVSPKTNVVVLTASAEAEDFFEALTAGAGGYILKQSPPEQIASGVRAAAFGGSPLAPPLASLLLERLREAPANGNSGGRDKVSLTDRERQVLALVAAGKDNTEIAERLVISQHTVKNHVSGILAKLKVENRIQAAVYAVRKGLV